MKIVTFEEYAIRAEPINGWSDDNAARASYDSYLAFCDLPQGCIDLLRMVSAQTEPAALTGGYENVAPILAKRGYLEHLPNRSATYQLTEMGQQYLKRLDP